MDQQELRARGLTVRKSIFGDAIVDKRMQSFGEFGAPLQDIINGFAYGDIWCRPGLDRKTRSLITIALNAALNRPFELRVHIQGALSNGCSQDEIREALLHLIPYCGIPTSMDGHKIAQEVFAEAARG
ncbi:MAG TPA: carboxymuconolactone decarboxylase family protein [Burkholderiales bacterium]|nr:carboxymuconolactone decarboxylase family protein [Burkholderiales bacterium]